METKTMETKTEKIVSVQENQRQYAGKVGTVFIHLIRFENDKDNKIWEYHSKKEICTEFKEGVSLTFDTDIQVNGNFTNYKIRPKQETNGNYTKKGETKDTGVITYLSCFSSACNFFASKLQASDTDVFTMAEDAFKKAVVKSSLNK